MKGIITIIILMLVMHQMRSQTLTGSSLNLSSTSPTITLNALSAGQTLDNDGKNAGWPGIIFKAYDVAGGPLVSKWNFTYSARDNQLYFYDYTHRIDAVQFKDNGNIVFKPFGNVGIGQLSPTTKLDILATALSGSEGLLKLQVDDAPKDYLKFSNATNATGQLIPNVYGYHSSDNREALYLTGAISSTNDSGTRPIMVFDSRISNTSVSNRPLFAWDSYGNRKMILNSNGSLGIGTTSTGSHKLAVNGTIGAREIKVEANGWSDFVFEQNYALPSLEEVENYISENKHLPDIPNEAEVTENGIELGEMNAKLLQKIEELTLHMIQINNRLKNLEQENAALKDEISTLKSTEESLTR